MVNIYTTYEAIPKSILLKLENANVFFSKEYYNYAVSTGRRIVFLSTGDYIIPYEVCKKYIFSSGKYISEPFCLNDDINTKENRKTFMNIIQEYVISQKICDWQESVGAYTLFDVYPDRSKRIGFGNLIINLEEDEETLFANMTSKHRNMVRRAEKDGVVVKFGGIDLLDDYCCLDAQTWKRSGRAPVDRKIYENILIQMPTSAFVAISYFNEIPQTGMLSYYNEQMMYYMYGASIDRPAIGANNYLHWEIMKEMKARKVKRYSFVGYRLSEEIDKKLAGIQHFKKGFGGELFEGYLFKEIFSQRKRRMFEFLYKLKNRTQLATDAIDQEIDKWQNINF